jgi:hypothetical protein
MPLPRSAWSDAAYAACFLVLAAGATCAATPPYVQLIGAVGTRGTCSAADAAPAFHATIDLGPTGAYRYSPAVVTPYFFDDEGEFNIAYNQDATLLVSSYVPAPVMQSNQPIPVAPLSTWYAAINRVPEHTELALRVATYDASGRSVATSRMTWDCTTGHIRSLEHRGTAASAVTATMPLIEFYNTALDHYFVTADPTEIGLLDDGGIAGWTRTGHGLNVWTAASNGANAVCRFYLPPDYGDSHFYSASPSECARVRTRFPSFIHESAAVFFAALPDFATGACATNTVPIYRLWNQRSDSNHRYTADPLVKAQMMAQGYVAEGYGPDAVSMCIAD